MCLRVEMQDEELYVKNHHFAFIKIAMLLLDCRIEAARERVLSEEFIPKGEKCLKTRISVSLRVFWAKRHCI